MYRKEKPLSLKGSTSALVNNLSVQVNREKGVINYGVVHKAVVNLVSASMDGSTVNHRQIVCKEPSATHGTSMVLQARLVQMPSRTLLVITSQKGIQMFEADGSLMLYWYALDLNQSEASTCFGRGICGVEGNTVCVGSHDGSILVFNIPARGTNITLSETLRAHQAAVCDMESEGASVVSSDDLGNIILWQAGEAFQQLRIITGDGNPCSSIGLWKDVIVGGYGTGHLRVFKASTGNMTAEITAHARWVTAVDISKTGMVLSAAEDSFVHIWKLQGDEIEHVFSDRVPDLQLQGAKFINDDGRAFGVTGYDSNELIFYTQS